MIRRLALTLLLLLLGQQANAAIAAVAGQESGTRLPDVTEVTAAFGDPVSVDSLVVVWVGRALNDGTSDPIAAGECSKASGTATIDTPTLDVSQAFDAGEGFINLGICSALVTGAGSLTMQFTGATSAATMFIAIGEYTGNWDAARVEANSVGGNAASDTNADTGNATAAGEALFAADVFAISGVFVAATEDAAFTLVFENGSGSGATSAIRRIVTTGTTDSGSWTLDANLGWNATLAVYREVLTGNPLRRRRSN